MWGPVSPSGGSVHVQAAEARLALAPHKPPFEVKEAALDSAITCRMASIAPGTIVTLSPQAESNLCFLPSTTGEIVIAVHPDAMKAPTNRLTLAAQVSGSGALIWVGAVDEQMLSGGSLSSSPRPLIAAVLFNSPRCWELLTPGELLMQPDTTTVYAGSRVWLALGVLSNSWLLAAPLSKASNPKWYTPEIRADCLPVDNPKDSQLDLPHLWSLPPRVHSLSQSVGVGCRASVEAAVRKYFA